MSSRRRRTGPALALARLTHVQWFAVNLYEAVVRIPERLADEHDRTDRPRGRGPLRRGSPARYHVPAIPLVLGSAVAAVATGPRSTGARRATVTAAGSSLAATVLTGYLVRTVNLRLLDDGGPITPDERDRLLARWDAVNGVRLVLLAVATAGFEYAARSGPETR
ncbi:MULTISPECIES: anthrone oxygenase family protein [Pseudonocardia]|uniref:DUF1772 domain-containing protein n=2 Tax=Pseudonocardia TaxID=1847 RepID=A0A1Y2N4C6_PSEAH|nr:MULTISPECIES: DUF1772 domain-containing protein [Pseudonocardia]OSY42315.1 hypothetical protein BG845_01235 [Pseudonocardia autotrophica]TDN75835.1 uncharacterized protein DUF1772 [Pseudonocardia autotrophica]BBF99806.1 hypothetical protein Pdca_10160 [Pseudonocardia autotrophica]GEC27608.1 hypothetical protein PSA01_46370 [Pseudonocardia saturnea]